MINLIKMIKNNQKNHLIQHTSAMFLLKICVHLINLWFEFILYHLKSLRDNRGWRSFCE